ncbi:RbsD/FucU domain-containing protein [Paracoccus aestuariivivens]
MRAVFTVVATGEIAVFANIILRKGVITAKELPEQAG